MAISPRDVQALGEIAGRVARETGALEVTLIGNLLGVDNSIAAGHRCRALLQMPGHPKPTRMGGVNEFREFEPSRECPHPACDGPLIPSGEPHVTKWTPATTFTLARAGHERVVSSLYPHESQRDAYWGTRNLHLPTTYPSRAGEGLGSCALPARPPRCPGVVPLRAANSPRRGASRSPFW